jgi:hypothetical protein
MSPEKALNILKKYGTIVSREEACLMVNFLNKLTAISVEIFIKKKIYKINFS